MERVAVNLLYDAAKAGVKARRQTSRAASKTLRLCVAVGQGCDGGLARAVKRALRPKTASLRLYVAGVGQGHEPAVVHAMADAVIVLAGQDAAVAADLYRAYASRRVPCLVLVNFDDAAAERARALVAREVSAEDIVVCDEMAVGGMLARRAGPPHRGTGGARQRDAGGTHLSQGRRYPGHACLRGCDALQACGELRCAHGQRAAGGCGRSHGVFACVQAGRRARPAHPASGVSCQGGGGRGGHMGGRHGHAGPYAPSRSG